MIEIQVNKKKYTDFVGLRLGQDIDTASQALSFSISKKILDIKGGDDIKVLIDNVTKFTGYVDTVSNTIDGGDLSQDVVCRSLIQDLIDSSLPDSVKIFKSGINLKVIIEKVLDALGINITVRNLAGTIDAFSRSERVEGEAGANAFEFITSYARKRQVFINSDGSGNLVLYRLNGLIAKNFDFVNTGKTANVLSATGEINLSDRFRYYVCKSQVTVESASGDSSEYSRQGKAEDTDIRASRYYEFVAEESMSVKECKARAEEEANLRRARSFLYRIKVDGHSQDGKVFDVAKGARVNDSILSIKGILLIKSLEFNVGDDGNTTDLELTYPDAYSVEANIEQKAQKRIDINNYIKK